MFRTTTRRPPRDAAARDRLERLARQASARPLDETGDLPADQSWVDLSVPARVDGRDNDGGDADHRGVDDRDADAVPPEAVLPWWRRGVTGRLVEHWVPGGEAPSARPLRPVMIAVAVVLAVGVVAGFLISGGRAREPAPALPAASIAPAATSAEPTGPAEGGPIVVSVIGKVARPGLVTVSDGARVADALQAAGGPLPGVDLVGLNLARRLSDGEQIAVGIPQPVDPAGPAPGAGSGGGPPAKIDLNSATVTALDALPGVGQVTAQRIIDWRTAHGRFTSVDQLREIDGIGPARFAKLKDLVVVR